MFDTKTFLDNLSLTWTTKYPNHQDRIDRGALLALSGKIAPRGLNTWRCVGTPKKEGEAAPEYTVTVTCGYPSCTCPDYTEKNQRCKHIWACAFLTRLVSEIEAQISKPTTPRKKLSQSLGEHCATLHTQNAEKVRGSR